MNKIKKLFLGIVLLVISIFTLSSCKKDRELLMGKDYLGLSSQLDSLNEVKKGTIDGCVIDSIMAGYYTNSPEYKDLSIVNNIDLLNEQFGIATKKGNLALIDKVNEALHALNGNTMNTIAKKYGIESEISISGNYISNGATDNS